MVSKSVLLFPFVLLAGLIVQEHGWLAQSSLVHPGANSIQLLGNTGSIQLSPSSAAIHTVGSFLSLALLADINRDRAAAGLPPLKAAGPLRQAALAHSREMAFHHYLSHIALNGASPYKRMAHQGVNRPYEGENIGYDTGGTDQTTLASIEVAMMHSPEHRANLLRRAFSHVGIGIVTAGDQVYVTEDFSS